ncbi:MAG: hypothetical protein K6B12_00995 [Clostridiales bacterium]|nr:hypothetical protein [Clostridiales bacterium]
MEYMGVVAFVFGIFGFLAYLNQGGLKKRITELERQLTKMQGTSYADDRKALVELAKECIGKPVKLDLKEDYGDVDIVMYGNSKYGTNTILDVDEDWMLVRVDSAKKAPKEKLIRLEAVQRIQLPEK